MEEKDKDRLLEKVKKLLALAGNNPNVEEAASAAAKAQALLFEHNLSMSDVELRTGTAEEEYVKQEGDIGGSKQSAAWRRTLCNAVAKANFCRAVFHHGESKVSVIGKASNMEIVAYLYGYLLDQTDRLWHEYKRSHFDASERDRGSYSYGVVSTITEKLEAQRHADANQSEACTALVLRSDKALAEVTRKHFPRLGPMSGGNYRQGSAYHQGRIDGRSINLRQGLGSRAAAGQIR